MSTRKKSKSGSKPVVHTKAGDVLVPVEIHPLAIAQARAFANLSRSIHLGTQGNGNHGELLAYLVNASLSIELYLKALMIVARGGHVTKGHDLDRLYSEFPAPFRDFLEFTYSSRRPAEGWSFTMHALKFSEAQPQVPEAHPRPQFRTFADALRTAKDAFVHARYFFEKVTTADWAVFAYSPVPLDAAMLALDATYEHVLAGSFGAGRDMIAERDVRLQLTSPAE
jgi:hypothetical protein